jgi:hypothetical protein
VLARAVAPNREMMLFASARNLSNVMGQTYPFVWVSYEAFGRVGGREVNVRAFHVGKSGISAIRASSFLLRGLEEEGRHPDAGTCGRNRKGLKRESQSAPFSRTG